MGNHKSKLKTLTLPAQSGKTRKVEEQIKLYKLINDLFGNKDEIDIWISANNKLLVHQTTSRIRKDLCSPCDSNYDGDVDDDKSISNAIIKGNVFSWTSGTKKTNISPKELAFDILNNDVSMVVLCAHPLRLKYLNTMIGLLINNTAFNKKINIWIDEADKTINVWSKFPNIINYEEINQITLVSATTVSIFKKYGRLGVIPYNITHPECYRCLKDANCFIEEIAMSRPVDYALHILNKNNLLKPGSRGFIPGNNKRESHEEIAEMGVLQGAVVLILNGIHKEIRIPGQAPIDLNPYLTVSDPDDIPDEFNTILSRIYSENKLYLLPFIVTGFMCVDRGITFQCAPIENDHNGFLFDYGVIPPISDKAEAYQTMARLFGNIGNFPDYKPCNIYTNSATFKRARNQEDIALNLAHIVYENNIDEVGPEHIRYAANYDIEKDLELNISEFNNIEDANEFLILNKCSRINKSNIDPTDNRFFMESTVKKLSRMSYEQVKKDISGFSISSNFDIRGGATQASRTYVCYRDLNDPTSIVYIIRIVKKKNIQDNVIRNTNPFED